MFSLGNNIVTTPTRYKVPDLNQGQPAILHIVTSDQFFINLKFLQDDNTQLYKPELTIDRLSEYEKNLAVQKKLKTIQRSIVLLDGIYTYYHYLFTVKENEIYLVSVATKDFTLNYSTVTQIASEINVKVLPFNWQGVYNSHVLNAFLEDIFVQKL